MFKFQSISVQPLIPASQFSTWLLQLTQVSRSLDALEEARAFAATGDYESACRAAQAARTAAEAAFSNPSVLAQLSFPQSHLIGVYVPFFLPVGLSVLQALVLEARRTIKGRRS